MPFDPSSPASQPRIDTHVHVFDDSAGLVADRRYTPAYSALPDTLLAAMAKTGIDRALLVQPSFLGTDNSYLLSAIAGRPRSFGGIAVVDPAIRRDQLAALQQAGIVGIRLNCIGKPAPDFTGLHGSLARLLAELDMVLQIQAEDGQWLAMADFLMASPGRIVIDHFGRTRSDHPDHGFPALLAAARANEALWFKFSAPYRLPEGRATDCARAILATIGTGRIVWGSDWPATQFEGRHDYADTMAWLADWLPDPVLREAVLRDNPARLYRFP